MSQSPLKIGLVGYGFAGKVFHTPLYNAAGVSLVAVASSDAKKVHADHPGVRIHATPTQLINDTDVELVVLVSPNFTHAKLAIEALDAGKHVLTDKPFTATVIEADEVIAAAKKTGLTISCYQNRRYDADFLTLQSIIERGDLGDIVHYQAFFNRYSPLVSDGWQEQEVPGVGNHYDLGAHLVDQALVLFGKPDWVQGDLVKQRAGSSIVDCFHVRMGQGNRRIELGAGMLVASNSLRYQVHGTKGSWIKHHLDPQEAQLWHLGVTPDNEQYGHEDASHYGELTQIIDGKAVTTTTPTLRGDWPRFYRDLAASIRNGEPAAVTAEQAKETIGIIEAMVESSQTGQRIHLG